MRSILLFVFLLLFTCSVSAQVILNEIHTEVKKTSESEFFVLYNTSTDPAGVNMDCYSLVVPYITGTGSIGVYLLDFPNITIQPRGYLVATSSTTLNANNKVTFNTQNTNGNIATFSWNLLNAPNQPTNGSLKSFAPVSGSGVPITTTNLFAPTSGNTLGGPILGVFLFKNSEYVNGFLAGYSSNSVPINIQSLGVISNLTNTCGAYNINFSTIKIAEQSGEAIGSSNGYRRVSDGLCGGWTKSASGESPGAPNNGVSRTQLTEGTLSTLEVINCHNKLEIQVRSPVTSNLYPVLVTIIRDVNLNASVEYGGASPDTVVATKVINSPMSTPFEFSEISNIKNIIIVYQTSYGCIDRVVLPEIPKGTYITSTVRFCNTIQYGISGLSGGALNRFATPVDVQIFEDLGIVGSYEPNVDRFIIALSYDSTAINTGTKTYSISTELLTSPLIVVYASSKYNCFITPKIDYLKAISGSLTTTESLVCNTLSVGITGRIGDAANLVNSVLVELYGINADGTYAPKFSSTLNLTNFTGTLSSFNVASYIYPSYELRYIPAGYTCLSKTATIQPKVVALKTNEGVVCKSVVFGVSGLSGNAPELADSVTVQLFGKNADGTFVFLANQRFRAPFPSTGWSGNFDIAINQYANYELRYLVSNYSCFTKIVSVANAAITYETTQVDYCGKQIGITVQKPVNLSPSLAFSVKAYIVLKDNGIVGTYEPGVDLVSSINPIELKEFPGSIKFASVPFDAAGQVFSIGFETPYPCLNKVVPISPATAVMQTVQSSFCGANTDPSTITFGISNVTGAASAFGYPISVDLYFTKDLTAKVASASITEVPSTGSFSIPYTDRGKQMSIVYTAVNNCFSSSSIIPAACTITPVKFSYFTAQRNNANANQVQLTWSTAMEQNNKGFYMQRMTGGNWEDIGFIGSTALQGNSTVPIKYQFRDINLFGGTSFYRLLQVDHDGKTDYSDVKSVYGPEKGDQRLVIYPNPAKGGSTTVAFPTNTSREIMLFDAFGQVLQQWRGYTGSRLQINQLQPGLYTIKVASGDKAPSIVERIIVQ